MDASEFGPGSAPPEADGSGPAGYAIKGNVDSMLFHAKDSPSFTHLRAGVWFEDEATAAAAGFERWDAHHRV
ncbi:MAG: hypothetical protein ABI083_09035 [Lapillicoccus sp.]